MDHRPTPNVPRRPRRGWFYVGVGLAALAGLLLLLAVGLALYWNYFIRTYSTTRPIPLPKVDASFEARDQLRIRFMAFYEALEKGKPAAPFRLSADDLNVAVQQHPSLKNRLFLRIQQDRIEGQYSFPLGILPQASLKDRFLNGTITFRLAGQNGVPVVRIDQWQANGQPMPGWLLVWLLRQNLLKDLEQNPDAAKFFQRLRQVEIKEGSILLHPKF